ncbi:MAG: hypothetical protein MH204_01705 [Fimbriimonadaceae bacterium]|nr:hypothetical protein [Fimbriimonadaceae bacterium]
MDGLSREEIEEALRQARRLGVSSVRISRGDERFSAILDPDFDEDAVDEEAADEESAPAKGRVAVLAQVVGRFAALPEFQAGGKVSKGDRLGVVRALGLANDVVAPADGILAEVLIEDGRPVEFGMTLAWIEEA